MNRVLFLLLLASLLSGKFCFGQEIIWKNTRHWKLYDIYNKKVFQYPTDTLQYFKSISLDDSIMHVFLESPNIWPPEKYSLWMGLFVASYETVDKQTRKIVISSYGGFFYDPLSKRYYELPENERADWYQYINDNAEKINDK